MTELLRLRITGSDSGITSQSDVLTNTADGTDLRSVWDEVRSVIGLYNRERADVTDLLSFQTTQAAVPVPQSVIPQPMQRASEYGVPKAAAYPPDVLKCGAKLDDYDLASRLSYRFLRDATQEQIVHQVNQLLASDRLLTTGLVLQRLFDPAEDENEWQHRCFGLYAGDGIVPPRYSQKTFDGTHNHYLPTGANELDSGDIENAFKHIQEHGYGRDPSSRLVILANSEDEGERIQSWRAGVANANGQTARYDFIPSSATPASQR